MTLKQTAFWKFKPDLEYMTPGERAAFNELRKGGAISWFRVGKCQKCGAEILKHKKYCSIECATSQEVTNDEQGNNDGTMD